MAPEQSPGDGNGDGNRWVALSGLGFEFLTAVLLPGAAGWWLDTKLGTAPWLMLIGGLIGFAAGLVLLLRASRDAFKK